MLPNSAVSLRSALVAVGNLNGSFLRGEGGSFAWSDLVRGSSLGGRAGDLRGRSVLVATSDQLTSALALVELDGIARRIVLCPADVQLEHLAFLIASANVEAVVSDGTVPGVNAQSVGTIIVSGLRTGSVDHDLRDQCQTEWVLLTSGTTGRPKLVAHTLGSLTGAIEHTASSGPVVWSTFYDIRRYGGLQIFLRAAVTGTSLVLSGARESTGDFLARAGSFGVTHISGTPSHWRRALMSPLAHRIAPRYIRLSGEIADQAILNNLRSFYSPDGIAHAFASTEAGVAFEVTDGIAGFPSRVTGQTKGVDIKVEDGSLRIRSTGAATRYLGDNAPPLKDADGFVDTGDAVALRDGRYYFIGRRDGIINVGGLKVYPEEVEAAISRHPEVRMSVVRSKKSPVTGALVIADVVLKTEPHSDAEDLTGLQHSILSLCRETLPAHKVPISVNFVPAVAVAETGKLVRRNA